MTVDLEFCITKDGGRTCTTYAMREGDTISGKRLTRDQIATMRDRVKKLFDDLIETVELTEQKAKEVQTTQTQNKQT